MTRPVRTGLAVVAALGALVYFLLTVGSLGEPHPELQRLAVGDVLAPGRVPAERFGDRELRISGWYAELDADCRGGSDGGASGAWLEARCPLRVLMPYQPSENASQAELEASGLRLASRTDAAFPSRARPEGPNLRLQQLVFVGHFDDPAAAQCSPARVEACRNTFVVSDYDGLIR
ncbi:MAG TPA: hypothetical protein VHK63_01635 [Candidatus Limnocylindria bacterium]|nr:hypothetical protein [Candidatus Limnocylindria bacterium]